MTPFLEIAPNGELRLTTFKIEPQVSSCRPEYESLGAPLRQETQALHMAWKRLPCQLCGLGV